MSKWWEHYPWRNIQTNLRQIDMMDIDAKEYVAQLKDLGATVTLLNAAGIIASYDTELDFQPKSEYLQGSSLAEIVEECHKAGIKVFCRTDFSKIRREVYEKHPEWAFRTAKGEIVDYNGDISTCPNGDYQKVYMHKILREVLTKIPFDGVFCNMSGFLVTDYDMNYYGICHCDSCKRMFRERFGEELPETMQPGNPSMMKYMAFKKQCEKEHEERVRATVRDINPQIAVNGLDYIRSESNTDIKRPAWPYSASSNARKDSGPARLRVADNNSVDFIGFQYRHISVSPELMELRQWQNLANSGNVSVYIMGHLGNHKDMSWYEGTKRVFDFHKAHEDLYTSMRSDAKVALVRNSGLEMDKEGQGWVRVLTQSHIPFDEIYVDEMDQPDRLEGKEVLILGNISLMSDEEAARIDAFVEQGGKVIVTASTGMMDENYTPRRGFALKCLGVSVTGRKNGMKSTMFELGEGEERFFPRTASAHYVAPGASMIEIKAREGTQSYFHVIPEHPFGPPERCYFTEVGTMPAVVKAAYGAGESIYIPFAAADFYAKEGYQNSLSFLQDVLFEICGITEIAPELSPMVEINICRTKEEKILQFVNTSGCFANHYVAPLPIYGLEVRIDEWLDESVDNDGELQAKTLNGGTVELERRGSEIWAKLDRLDHYDAIVLSSQK